MLDAEHQRRDVTVSSIGEDESVVVSPVASRWRPRLMILQLELPTISAFDFGW